MRKQSLCFASPPVVLGEAAIVGKKEGLGPLGHEFHRVEEDSRFGEKSWEAAETTLQRRCMDMALKRSGLASEELDFILSGDLQAQCTASAFAARESAVPWLGLYGACSTMGEALVLASMLLAGGFARNCCALSSSHFCTAERQFRTPLEYGGQRCPSAQWTVTGGGALILSKSGRGPRISHVTPGRIVDAGICDPCSMGAAMAPAAAHSIAAHLRDTGRSASYYDALISGDLGHVGHRLLASLLEREGIVPPAVFSDCGILVYEGALQDTHAGGSGCGCCAAVLCGHILRRLRSGVWRRVLFAPTGALMSPGSALQGESIPGICHVIAFESEES